ncbi:MFS transporter [Streptomyces sp. NPDC093225]|uniref:MFS transporter n=1 Tax=Streptomyces sp. NPDC093225 TaxID=3366034 RepID=UPI00380B6635
MTKGIGTTRTVLRDRNARLYLSGTLVSDFGTAALWLAAGIWVKTLTGSDALAALTSFALWAPVLAGPALGALADRLPRRPLLVAVGLVMAALLPLLLLVDSEREVWLVFAVLLVYGAAGTVHDAAEAALVARTVDPGLRGHFNGLRMTAAEAMKLVAPLAGAGLCARFGGGAVALLDAATFAVAALMFALLRLPAAAEGPRVPGRREADGRRGPGGFTAGARVLWDSPVLRPLVLAGSAVMLLAGLNGAAIYAVADRLLGRAPAYVGVLYAVQGAGSVAAGLAAGPLLRRLPERACAASGAALFALGAGVRALPYDAAALCGSAAVGLGLPLVLTAALTAVQRETPDAVLGRTAATANTLLFAPNAVALALGAGLAAVADVRLVLVGVAGAGLVVAGALARGSSRGGAERPGRPEPATEEKATA